MDSSRDKSSRTSQVQFSSPRKLGKGKGSGLAIDLPFSATEYLSKVNSILEAEEDRERLFNVVRSYHENHRVKKLVKDLMVILDTPKKYPLFNEIRGLIPAEHVFAYNKLTEGAKTGERLVVVKRQGTDPFGFHVRGGKEHGCGIFVTGIIDGSPADGSGLKVGDEILRINRLILVECIHEEVINILKNRKVVTLVVRFMAQVPSKVDNRLEWIPIEQQQRPLSNSGSPTKNAGLQRDRLLAFKISKDGLGCTVRPGIPNHDGVYVSVVTPGSLAEQVGLKVGDQIFDVNGKNFTGIKQNEALEILKSKTQLTMVVRHNPKAKEYFEKKDQARREKAERLAREENEEINGIRSILRKGTQPKNTTKNAHFGKELVVQVIDTPATEPFSDTGEEEEENVAHPSNLEYDEQLLGKLEAHFLSIPKLAPLSIEVAQKEHKIIVTNINPNGAAGEHGFLRRGDWILNVEGTSCIGMSLPEAEETLTDAMSHLAAYLDIIIACKPGRVARPSTSSLDQLNSTHQQQASTEKENGDDDIKVKNAIAVFESLKQGNPGSRVMRKDSLEKFKNNSLKLYQAKKRPEVKSASIIGPRITTRDEGSTSGNDDVFLPSAPRNDVRSVSPLPVAPSQSYSSTAVSPSPARPAWRPTSPVKYIPSSPVKFVPVRSNSIGSNKADVASSQNVTNEMQSSYVEKRTIFGNNKPPSVEQSSPKHSFSIQPQVFQQPTANRSPSRAIKGNNDASALMSNDVLLEDQKLRRPSTAPSVPIEAPPAPNEFTSVKSFWKDAELDESDDEVDLGNTDPFAESGHHIPVRRESEAIPKIASTVTNSPLYTPPNPSYSQSEHTRAGPTSVANGQHKEKRIPFKSLVSDTSRMSSGRSLHTPSMATNSNTVAKPAQNFTVTLTNTPSHTYPYSNNLQKVTGGDYMSRTAAKTVNAQDRPQHIRNSASIPTTDLASSHLDKSVPNSNPVTTGAPKVVPSRPIMHSAHVSSGKRVMAIQTKLTNAHVSSSKELNNTASFGIINSEDVNKRDEQASQKIGQIPDETNRTRLRSPPPQRHSKHQSDERSFDDRVRPQNTANMKNESDKVNSSAAKTFAPPVSPRPIKRSQPVTRNAAYLPAYQRKMYSHVAPPQASYTGSPNGQNTSIINGRETSNIDVGGPLEWVKSVNNQNSQYGDPPPEKPASSQGININSGSHLHPTLHSPTDRSSLVQPQKTARLKSHSNSFKKVTFQAEGLKDKSSDEPVVDPAELKRRSASIADGLLAVETVRKNSNPKSPSSAMRQSMVDLRANSPSGSDSMSPALPSSSPRPNPTQGGVDSGKSNSVVFMDGDESSNFLSSLNAMLGQATFHPQQSPPQQKKEPPPRKLIVPAAPSTHQEQNRTTTGETNLPKPGTSRDNSWKNDLPPRDYGIVDENNDGRDAAPRNSHSSHAAQSRGTAPPNVPPPPPPPAAQGGSMPGLGFSGAQLDAAKGMLRSSKSPAPVRAMQGGTPSQSFGDGRNNRPKQTATPSGPPINNIVDELKNKVFKQDRKFANMHHQQAKDENVTTQGRPSSANHDISEMNDSLRELDNVIRSLDDEAQN